MATSVHTTTFQLDGYSELGTASPAIWITLAENPDGSLTITAEVQGPVIGDLRGLFFDVTEESLLGKLSIPQTGLTSAVAIGDDDITQVGQVSVNGLTPEGGGFDVGIEIGTPGAHTDDVRSYSVTLSTNDNTAVKLTDFALAEFGIRITSVGSEGGSRELSDKIIGKVPPTLTVSPPPDLIDLPQALSNLVLYIEDGGDVFKVKLEAGNQVITQIDMNALRASIADAYGTEAVWLGVSIHAGNAFKNDARFDGTAEGEGAFYLVGGITPIQAVGTKAGKGWSYDWSVDDYDNVTGKPTQEALDLGITNVLLQQQASLAYDISPWM